MAIPKSVLDSLIFFHLQEHVLEEEDFAEIISLERKLAKYQRNVSTQRTHCSEGQAKESKERCHVL